MLSHHYLPRLDKKECRGRQIIVLHGRCVGARFGSDDTYSILVCNGSCPQLLTGTAVSY